MTEDEFHPLTQATFERIISSFDSAESMRGKVYYRVLNLIRNSYILEGHLLLLATWNLARFHYFITRFNLSDYQALLDDLSSHLRPISQADFATVNLDQHRKLISDSFDRLAAIKGIEFTGASKILHLLNPRVFVMWDTAISGRHIPKKDYFNLDVIRYGFWKPPRNPFGRSGAGYWEFLAYCQSQFDGLVSPSSDKTLAKCIDEFNYCTITKALPRRRRKLRRHGNQDGPEPTAETA
jgi:hypothetical protein